MEADKKINHLTGKVAQYYGLEESDIQIQWKMTKKSGCYCFL